MHDIVLLHEIGRVTLHLKGYGAALCEEKRELIITHKQVAIAPHLSQTGLFAVFL